MIATKKPLAWLLLSSLLSLPAAGACAADGNGNRTVMVDWKGTPYKAQILKSENGRHYVHYEGWPSSYDEWIMDSHIIAEDGRKAAPAATPKTRPPPQRIWVLWHGKPYEADILKSESGRHFVHFPGWPSSYDEWIGEAQIIPADKARALLAKQGNGGAAARQGAYQGLDDMRDRANRLNQETMQQYRDTERHYENKRLYGN